MLEVDGLVKEFHLAGSGPAWRRAPATAVHAVSGVSFGVAPGEVLAIVGESGCGKTTVARMLVGLAEPSAGTIRVDGRELGADRGRAERRLIQLVPQNPWSAFNRRRTTGHALHQALAVHEPDLGTAERTERVETVTTQVGLATEHLARRPGDVSGGELTRLVLARVLLVRPKVIVLDEPTASLDASVKATVVSLLMTLRAELGLAMVLITHEIPIARQVADRTAVMYLGRIVEAGPTRHVLRAPAHPYSRMLLASVPQGEPGALLGAPGRGEVPSAAAPPAGCAYHPRCSYQGEGCASAVPELLVHGRRDVACHRIAAIDSVHSPFGEPNILPSRCCPDEPLPHQPKEKS
ncbi:MAG: oligopeptide/dipeptide ABC transporter ATP-binding protein [Trebonia sp.]